jgi:uncharacterized protein (DUF1330 family)
MPVPAYVVAYTEVTDPEPFGRYAAQVTAVTESFGGRYLWAGPGSELLEGEFPGNGHAIIEFPTRTDALRWYRSPEYRELIPLRQAAGPSALVLTPDAG